MLKDAIFRNKRRKLVRERLRRIRLNHFVYIDAGKGEKAKRVVQRLLAVLKKRG